MVELAAKTVLAVAAFGYAAPAYRYAEAAVLRANAPLEAAKIVSEDAKVLGHVLGGQFDSNPGFKPSAQDVANIRKALIAQPLEPKLLSIMGLAYETNGNTKQAAEAMRVANRASRHDSVSGLYLIESASASGDVNATLRHYNALLSTQPELNAALLPILVSAIAYPEIRTALRLYLQSDVKWAPAFLAEAADKASTTDLQSLLLPVPRTLFSEEYQPILASVLHRLAVEGDRPATLRFASAAIPGFSATSLTDLSVDSATMDKRLGLFSWTFPLNDGIMVEVGGDKSLQIHAEPLARGTVAVRDLFLEGGKYQLVQHLKFGPEAGRIDARWSADCITSDGAARFWDQRLPILGAPSAYRSELVVPNDCMVVRLTLSAQGPDGQLPSTLTLSDLLLSRKITMFQ